MPIASNLYRVGVAKQTAFGVVAAAPTFAHGISSDGAITVDPKQQVADVGSGSRVGSTIDRTEVANGASFDTRAYMRALGLYLLGLFGSEAVTGTELKSHAYSLGDSLPYLTFFDALGATSAQKLRAVQDCIVDEVKIVWKVNEAATISVSALGTKFSVPVAFTPGTDETGTKGFLVPVGGTFELAGVGPTPSAAVITEGEIDLKNNAVQYFGSGSIEAALAYFGTMEATCKFTVIPDDISLWLASITGTTAGGTVAPYAPMGSFSTTLKENQGTGSLAMSCTEGVGFVSAYPKFSAKGGAAELALDGDIVMPAGGTSPVDMVLANDVTSY